MSEITPGALGATPPPLTEPPPVVTHPSGTDSDSAAPAEPLVPWISIWTRPRATLRQVLDSEPRRWVFRLAALGGVAGALRLASKSGFGDTHSASIVLAVCIAGGAVGGILALFLLTSLVGLAGRWLGGQGRMSEVMAALAWSYVPAIWGLALWLPRAALLGEETFQSLPASIEGNPPAALLFGFLQLAQTLIGIWGFLITLKCIAEAQRFSAWRAFGAFVLVGLMVGVPVGLAMLGLQTLS
jgi:Yip1 domain